LYNAAREVKVYGANLLLLPQISFTGFSIESVLLTILV